MKRSLILLLVISLPFFTGCDFFRSLAGRPTSKDIEHKQVKVLLAEKAELVSENVALASRLDSVEREFRTIKDSLNALDSISQYGGTILNPTTLGGLFSTKLEARYYVIVGAFRYRTNAELLYKKAVAEGYRPALISFRNGKMAVGVCPSNSITEVFASLKKIRREDFCPADVWVLLNE